MENKKKNNILLIVVIVVISLLLVGTLAYFTYDKIFKEDKPIEENKDNKDNTDSDNENKTDVKMNSSYDNSTILKSLVDAGFIIDKECDNICASEYLEISHFGWTYKINENKKLVVTYYDDEYDKNVSKTIDEIGNVTKVFPIYSGGTIVVTYVFTENGEIYYFGGMYYGQELEKINNNTGKKLKGLYENFVTADLYVSFDDDSLIQLDFEDDGPVKLGRNIRDNNLLIGGFSYGQCGDVCPPNEVMIYGDGTIKYITGKNDDGYKYSTIKYNGKDLDIKYAYFIENSSIYDLYFVDNNNDIYVISNYYNSDKDVYSKDIKIEKLSYKFDSVKTNKKTIYEDGYSYEEITYTAKFTDGSTKTIDSYRFIDLTNTRYTTLFNLYKNSKKSS